MNTTATNTQAGPESIPASQESYGIVAFSHLRWSFVWQRPQQFLSRFAKKHPVLFIEEPEYILGSTEEARIHLESPCPDVTVARFILPADLSGDHRFSAVAQQLTSQAIQKVNSNGEFDKPLLWFYNPMDTPWAVNEFNRRGVVYDCMDELSQFKFAPKRLVENEAMLINRADILFTGGYELWLRKKQQHANVHFFGCGVEFDHFAKAQFDDTELPEDVRDIPHPTLGWFGVIDERMDYDLIARMADLKPEWNFIMVGPVAKVDPNLLPQKSNIHWVGQRDYSVLPNYCKSFDVCMMSFAINEATEFINPTKALEYLATGRPVISTPVKDVVRQYTEHVAIAATAEEFVRGAEQALSEPDQQQIQLGIERARQSSWESTVEKMQQLIDEAISKRGLEDKRELAPMV